MSTNTAKSSSKPKQMCKLPKFLLKTFKILEAEAHPDIIAWNEKGDEFKILDISSFEKYVLPKHFKHNKFKSFVRQLHIYGFHKTRKKSKIKIFFHPFFKKNRFDLLRKIERKKTKENKEKMMDLTSTITELRVQCNQLKAEKSKGMIENLVQKCDDEIVKTGFLQMVEILDKSMVLGEFSLTQVEMKKFDMIKNLFQNFKNFDQMKEVNNETDTQFDDTSFLDFEWSGEEKTEDEFLGKRSYSETDFSSIERGYMNNWEGGRSGLVKRDEGE